MSAFRRAAVDGADGLEFDIRLTRDRQWVVYHDADAVVDGRRSPVRSMTAAEAVSVPVGPGHDRIPALSELLMWSREAQMPLLFDIKDRDGIAELVAAVEAMPQASPPSFSSFHRAVLRKIEALRSGWPRFLIVGDPRFVLARRALFPIILSWALRHRLTGLNLHERWITPEVIERIHDAGLTVFVWTVDDPLRMVMLSALGVDGIITNCPDAARPALAGNTGQDHAGTIRR